jgi:NAD(P)H-dependent FMN reductase
VSDAARSEVPKEPVLKLFALAGSRRAASHNRALLGHAVAIAERAGASVDVGELRDFDMPLYDGDLEVSSGIPDGAARLAERITAADGLLIASPEYNFSVPGVLKNAIDWLSRTRPMPLRGKRALLLSASPSLVGGNRGLWALRVPLEVLGVHVYPDMYSLAQAHEKLGDAGVNDAALAKFLDRLVGRFVAELGALA